MSERVTDEWLMQQKASAENRADEICPNWTVWQELEVATSLAFAQSIARECLRMIRVGAGTKHIIEQIRARFGL